jgi:hypothetical protein
MNKLRSTLLGVLLGVGVLLVAWGHRPAPAQGDAKQVGVTEQEFGADTVHEQSATNGELELSVSVSLGPRC